MRLPKRDQKSTKEVRREKNIFHGGRDQICPIGQMTGIHSRDSLNINKNKTNTSTHHPA